MIIEVNNTLCPWCSNLFTEDFGQIYLPDKKLSINVHYDCMGEMLSNVSVTIERLSKRVKAQYDYFRRAGVDIDNENALIGTLRWFEIFVEDGIN